MRKNFTKIIPILIFILMLISFVTPAVKAAEITTKDIKVEVKVSGPQQIPAEEFLIEINPEEGNPMPGENLTIKIKGGSEGFIKGITYSRVGIYKYKVKQLPGTVTNATYDNDIYHLTIVVTNNGNGLAINAWAKKGESTSKSEIVFNNRYPTPSTPPSPVLPAKVKLRALKSLDEEIPVNQKFTFLLSDDNGTILQTKSNEAQNIDFDEMEYSEIGTSNYYIQEKNEVDGKYIYDDTVYQVIVKVSRNNNGDYEANTSYLINGTPFTRIPIFENETVPGKLPDTGGEEKPEPEPGDLPDTGGEKPGPVVVPDTGVKPGPPELPKTGEAKSTLPMMGIIMILGGITLSLRRKATK